MTPAQIEAFQEDLSNRDWLGKRLKIDGDNGPKTRWAIAVSRLDPRRRAIVLRAVSCVGETESDGPNRSNRIDTWNARCGVALGSPYCASFASWCLSGDELGLAEIRQASAQALGRMFPESSAIAQAGDLMWFPTGEHTGHCGIVVGVGAGEVACVEGNQDNAVRLVRRAMEKPVRFGRTVPSSESPGVPPDLRLVPAAFAGTR